LHGADATIAGARGFELIGHYIPCALCHKERIPYSLAIPVAVLAFAFSFNERTQGISRFLLLVLAGLFAWSVYQGVFHAGIEYQWWTPQLDCGVGAVGGRGDLLNQLQTVHIPRCDTAAWRFPAEWGLSFAGWNAVISTGLVLVALAGVFSRRRSA
ncbi:MAG: disulfide bond formation protein B, partial [Bauldia sp.]